MKKQLYKLFCLLGFIVITAQSSFATHVVGGNLTYKCLGGDLYEVTLEFRRDCFLGDPGAQFDDPVSIGIFDADGMLVSTAGQGGELFINFSEDDTLNETLTSECEVLGSDVCVQTTVYRKTITLPFLAGGYILAYQRCCRNQSLTNILDPNDYGGTYWTTISETSLNECNSSPVFDEWPTVYLCVNEPLSFDHSATDAEGDSLVYKLCQPHSGASPETGFVKPQPPNPPPYANIVWQAGFSTDNMMGGDALTINPETGLLEGSPSVVGQFLIGICVEEYRNGELIGMTYRDFEYNTRICERNPNASFVPDTEIDCDDYEIAFDNTSSSDADAIWYFDYPNTDLTSNDFDPTFQFPGPGLYQVALFVTKGPCMDSTFLEIGVATDNDIMLDFTVDYETCQDKLEVSLEDLSVINLDVISAEYMFSSSDTSFTVPATTTNVILNTEGIYTIVLLVETVSGCSEKAEEIIDFDISSEVLLPVVGSGNLCDEEFSLNVIMSSIEVEWFLDPEMTQSLGTMNPLDLISENFGIDDTLYVVQLNANCPNFTAVPLDIVPSMEDIIVVEGGGNFCEDEFSLLVTTAGEYAWYTDPALMNQIGDQNPIVLDPADYLAGDTLYVVQTSTICPNRTAVPLTLVMNEGSLDLEESVLTCKEDFVELNPDGSADYSYMWTSIPAGAIGDPTAVNPSVNVVDSTTFYVEAVVNGSCIIYDTIMINPQVLEIDITTDTIYYCKGEAVVVSANVEGATGVTWFDEDNEIVGGGDTFTYFPDGTETLTVFATNQIACDESDKITLIPYEFFGEISGDNISCIDEDITLMVDYSDPLQDFTYTWFPEEVFGMNTTGTEQTAVFPGTTEVVVMVENQIGCTWEMTYTVTLDEFDSFSIDADAQPNNILLTESTQLEVDNLPNATYEWEPEEFLDDPSIYNPIGTPTETVVYTVTVTNENGCIAIDTVSVRVIPPICDETDIFVPNTFTPNGDGLNDYFKVRSNFIDEYEIIVYNRWGEEVYATKDPADPGWDGKFDNTDLEADVYGYHLRVLCIGGEEFVKQGNITIVK